MTRRERLESKLDKRRQWAEARAAKSAAAFDSAGELADQIPMGQPVLIGHHSEKRHRRHLDRIDSKMGQGVEHSKMADHHRSKADGLEHQLERSVYSDDADAIEQIEARIAEREAMRDGLKAVNAAWRKAGKPDPEKAEEWARMSDALPEWSAEALERMRVSFSRLRGWHPNAKPVESYQLSNLGANIRNDRQRIEDIQRRQDRTAEAEAAGGVTIARHDPGEGLRPWAVVTFAEKPERSIIAALKESGFGWGNGSWSGYADNLPPAVLELAEAARKGRP